MHSIYKQKTQLLLSIEELLEIYESNSTLSVENWDDIESGLLAIGLPEENIMLGLIETCPTDSTAFLELKRYFTRFYDAQISAAAH